MATREERRRGREGGGEVANRPLLQPLLLKGSEFPLSPLPGQFPPRFPTCATGDRGSSWKRAPRSKVVEERNVPRRQVAFEATLTFGPKFPRDVRPSRWRFEFAGENEFRDFRLLVTSWIDQLREQEGRKEGNTTLDGEFRRYLYAPLCSKTCWYQMEMLDDHLSLVCNYESCLKRSIPTLPRNGAGVIRGASFQRRIVSFRGKKKWNNRGNNC